MIQLQFQCTLPSKEQNCMQNSTEGKRAAVGATGIGMYHVLQANLPLKCGIFFLLNQLEIRCESIAVLEMRISQDILGL